VAAAVPQPGQGVVLGQDGDTRSPSPLTTQLGFEGCGHTRGAHLDRYAGRLQHARQASGGFNLLVADLGVGVNPVGGGDQFGGIALDGITNTLLELLYLVWHHAYCCASRTTRNV
jgi:hypothetical protein